MKDQLLQIFKEIINCLNANRATISDKVAIEGLGEFSFLQVDHSWSKLMLLGAFEYYKDADIKAYQIVPDVSHFTFDTPGCSHYGANAVGRG